MQAHEYEGRKRSLDTQLANGIDLLRAAHRAQRLALDLVWRASPWNPRPEPLPLQEQEVTGAPLPSPGEPTPATAEPKAPRRRWGAGELDEAVVAALDRLPETFDRHDVVAALGDTPDRSSLFRVLEVLCYEGILEVARRGGGRVTTRYRRREPASHPPEAE
jgi:hypothetical protein